MKISTRSAILALLPALSCSVDAVFSPSRIAFDSLLSGKANGQLLDAMQGVGMVSITNVPNFDSKMKALNELPGCMDESSVLSMQLNLPDGTRRRTLATHSKGCKGDSNLKVADHDACSGFQEASHIFRQTFAQVVETFGDVLATALNMDQLKPVLVDGANNGYSFNEIFAQGDQLEHFHVYDKKESKNTNEDSIEWHIDQGLALAFTPGMVDGKASDGFYISLSDGATVMVEFEDKDDVVVLLGDGVNQYINRALDPEQPPLRAVPHAFRMPATSAPRVWYGRMVLPPADALHPLHSLTFGEIREGMLAEDVISSEFGCSNDMVARELQDTTCDEESFYCWHRCMNFTDYNVSTAICEEQGLDLSCVNEEGLLWPTDTHNPSVFLGCVDLATAEYISVADDSDEADETQAPTVEDGVLGIKAMTGWTVAAVTILVVMFGA